MNSAPVKVGIVGSGNVLWAYLQVMDRLIPRGDAVLGPVCCRRRETWPALASRRPGIELVATAREIAESDVDVAVIITPPNSHAELTRMCLESGKHVVVEKPMAGTRAEAQRLADVATAEGKHLLAAPFVQLAPTFRMFWSQIREGAIGKPHSARGLYGNAGSIWARWYHDGSVGPLAEVGIYNLKSLTAILGPVAEVFAAECVAVQPRQVGEEWIEEPGADVSHLILRHEAGPLSSIVSSHAIQRYKRAGLEIYGTEGTANLLGDDWDPRGFEIWRNQDGFWKEYESVEPTWLWADGLRELIMALRQGRPPLASLEHDLHLLEILEAASKSVTQKRSIPVQSRFSALDLRPEELHLRTDVQHLHDHTRPSDEQ